MTVPGSASVNGVIVLVCSGAVHAGQAPPPQSSVTLSEDEKETFLLEAEITNLRSAGDGVTNSQRATLTDGRLTHDAHIQAVDQAKPVFRVGKVVEFDFKDSYRYNVAAYELARLLQVNVPVSVVRKVGDRTAAVTWWVDDVLVDEETRAKKEMFPPDGARFSRQFQILRIFDALIHNSDRNPGNLLWTSDWELWMIDHTRAFRLGRELVNASEIRRIDRVLLQNLRSLTLERVTEAVGRNLTRDEITAVLARRDLIVQRLDELIAQHGEATVLFDEIARP
jgi:hypothetical protein